MLELRVIIKIMSVVDSASVVDSVSVLWKTVTVVVCTSVVDTICG